MTYSRCAVLQTIPTLNWPHISITYFQLHVQCLIPFALNLALFSKALSAYFLSLLTHAFCLCQSAPLSISLSVSVFLPSSKLSVSLNCQVHVAIAHGLTFLACYCAQELPSKDLVHQCRGQSCLNTIHCR